MAAEEKRSVTIKVNGQEVAASIKLVEKELAKARLELKNATVGTKEYNAAMKRIGELSPILNKHRADIRNVSTDLNSVGKTAGGLRGSLGGIFSSLGQGFSGLKGSLGGIVGMAGPLGLLVGGVTALVSGIGGGIATMREFESAMMALKVRTGITSEGVAELKDGAIELASAYGTAPTAIIKAFSEAASARPELVGNTKALEGFTEQALILSKITGEEVNTTIADLTTIMNTNGIVTSDTAKTVNMLVGASQKGAKEVPFLAQAMQKIGGAAASANVGLAEQAATLELLGEKYTSSAETAGTNVRNILITLQEEWAKNNEGPFDFRAALDQLKPSMNDITELTDLFGKENAVAAQTLLQNTERLDELKIGIEEFTGASDLAIESQQTMDGQLAILSAKWDGLWASMTDEGGALTALIGGFNIVIDKIGEAYDAGIRFMREIVDKDGLMYEDGLKQAENDKNLRKNLAFKKLQDEGLEAARKEADVMAEKAKLHDENSAAYQRLTNYANELYDVVERREEELAVAEDKKRAAAAEEEDRRKERDKSRAESAARHKSVKQEEFVYTAENIAALREELALMAQKTEELNKQRRKATGVGEGAESISSVKSSGTELATVLGGVKSQADAEAQVVLQSEVELQDKKDQIQEERERLRREKQIANLKEIGDITIQAYDALGSEIFNLISVGSQERTKRELKDLEDRKNKGLVNDKQYAQQKEKIERDAFERKKRLDRSAAIIDGLVGIGKTFAQFGFPAGVVPAALLAAQTAIRVAAINKQKFALGGPIVGPSHAQGGVDINAEGGEYVIRKRSVNANTLPLLQRINESGVLPSINFSQSARRLVMEQGGYVDRNMGQGVAMSNDAVVKAIAMLGDRMERMETQKRVVLVKDDVDTFDGRVARVSKIAAP